MKVDPAELRDGQKAGRDDLAVSDDDDAIGREALQQLLRFGRTDFFRLVHRDVRRESGFLYGGKGDLPAAASRTVGLGDYGNDVEVGLSEEMNEDGDGEVGGAAEEEAHELLQRIERGDVAVEILRCAQDDTGLEGGCISPLALFS